MVRAQQFYEFSDTREIKKDEKSETLYTTYAKLRRINCVIKSYKKLKIQKCTPKKITQDRCDPSRNTTISCINPIGIEKVFKFSGVN